MRRKRLRVRLLLLPLLLHAACQDDATKLQEHLARGEGYAKEGRYAEAQIEFKSALQIDPNHADAHYKLAHAYLQGRKVRQGFWELRETARLAPDNHAARLEFAQLAILAGEQEEALKQADDVIAADATNVAAYLIRGQALDALKRPDEALEAYRTGLATAPDDPGALRAVAHALGARGKLDEAEKIWLQVIAREPGYASHTAYAGFLRRYHPNDRLADAEAQLHKALELAEESEKQAAYAQIANLYFSTQREEESVAVLREGIEAVEDPVELIYILARLERVRGNTAEADALVERATQERPEDPEVFLVLASYRARNGDRVGGLEAADKAVALDPNRTDSKLRKAEILVEMGFRKEREGGIDEASAIVSEVLAKHPKNPNALFVDAKIKLTKNQIQEAIVSVRAAIEGRPEWAEARYVLGAALATNNEYAAARSELGRALELDPTLADATQALAQVHQRLGEHEYAVDVGRRYQRMRPDDLKMRLLVAQSLVNLGKLSEAQAELDGVPAEKQNPEVRYAQGRIAVGRGELEIARAHFVAAAAGLPNQPDVLENLVDLDNRQVAAAERKKDAAQIAAARERRAESIALIREAIAAKPNDAKLKQLEGVVAVVEERIDDAEAALEASIDLEPTERSGYDRLARLYNATGRMPQAIEVYEKAVEVLPDDPQFHHTLGMLYELRGEADRAVPHYEEAIRLAPNLAEAKNNLAYIYADQGRNLDRALDLAQDAKTLLPNNPSVADTLGWVLYKRGVPGAAISYLKEAEAASPKGDGSLGVVRHHLALAYEANGDMEEALAALDRALEVAEGQPGPEPDWVAEARDQRQRLVGQRGSG